jgi:hypothetical protein
MRRATILLSALLLGLGILGCSGNNLTKIRGDVTLDGKPIERGTIRAVAVDGKTPSAEAVIQNGKYEMQVTPGKKKIEIQGFKVVGQERRNNDPSAPLEDVTETIVPAKFNSQTELEREIVAGTATYDFSLQSR